VDSLGFRHARAYNTMMRTRDFPLLLLATAALASCAYTDRFPFRTVANPGAASQIPPGVRIALYLDGVHEVPTEGVPIRSYELRIELEQDPDMPQWRPALDDARLRDDEGNVMPLSAWFVDDSQAKAGGLRRYRCVFELRIPYRFQSIMGATVHWKLVSRGSPIFSVTSRFQQ
jgi:hypothetical protein